MKILLINPNKESAPIYAFPLGLLSVTSEIPDKHNISVIDLCFDTNPIETLKHTICSFSPNLIGVSIRNITSGAPLIYRNYIAYYKAIFKAIHKFALCPIILGGAGFSLYPEYILRTLNVKYGIIGEGEIGFKEFIEYIEGSRSIYNVSSLIYQLNNSYKKNNKTIIHNLDNLSFPKTYLFSFNNYLMHKAPIGLQTKRGCAFNCIYCNYPLLEGSEYRLKSIERVIDEIKLYKQTYKTNYFYFTDSVFTYPTKYAKNVLKTLIAERINIQWQAYANPLGIDKEMAFLIKKSGCTGLELGIDSYNNKTLKSYHKHFTVGSIRKSIKLLDEMGIPLSLDIIVGGPGDSNISCNRTLESLKGDNVNHGIFINYGMQVFHNTPLERYSGINAKKIRFDNPPMYMGKYISDNLAEINNKFLTLKHTELISSYNLHKKYLMQKHGYFKKIFNRIKNYFQNRLPS